MGPYQLNLSANTSIPIGRDRYSSVMSGKTLVESNGGVLTEAPVKKENVPMTKPRTPSPKKLASQSDSPTLTRKAAMISNGSSPARKIRSGY